MTKYLYRVEKMTGRLIPKNAGISLALAAAVFSLLLASLASATIPRLLSLQGKLTDSSDQALTGTYNITFRIYDASSGGSPLWWENQSVTASNGLFSALLGSTSAMNLPFNTSYWLSFEVASNGEMSPRQRIASSGYAIRANITDFIAAGAKGEGNLTVGTNTLHVDVSNDRVGIGTAGPAKILHVNTAGNSGEVLLESTLAGAADTRFAVKTTNRTWFFGQNIASIGAGKFSFYDSVADTTRLTIDTSGNVGIGTTGPTNKLDVVSSGPNVIRAMSIQNLQASTIGTGTALGFYLNGSGAAVDEFARIGAVATNVTSNAGDIFFSTETGGSLTEKVRITGAGNVGIGTTGPEQKLDVGGNIRLSSDLIFSPQIYSGIMQLTSAPQSITQTGVTIVYGTTANFNPNTWQDVIEIDFNGRQANDFVIQSASIHAPRLGGGSTGVSLYGNAQIPRFVIKNGGVNTISPASSITWTADLQVTTAGDSCCTAEARWVDAGAGKIVIQLYHQDPAADIGPMTYVLTIVTSGHSGGFAIKKLL